jgi:Na+/H+ antiporter NhaD/arsenite permease-like protein
MNVSDSKMFEKNKKKIIGLVVLVVFAISIMSIPDLLGYKASLALKLSAITLLSVYVVLSFEIVHRTAIALTGAIAIIIIGITTGLFPATSSFEFAVDSIDFNTIGLLLGMMIIVVVMAESGVFQYVGIKMCKASKGSLWKLLVLMCTFTAVTSMFIDNVTTILLMVPVTISVFRLFKLSPIPFILAQVFMSNVGGTATLIGDPPNIMIGSAANIDFNAFIIHMGPTIAISLVFSMILLKFMFRKELSAKPQNLEILMTENKNSLIKDKGLLKKSAGVLFGVIVLFVIHGIIHIQPSLIALGGAGILLIIARVKLEKIFQEVDWSTLIFFAGLFIIISGTERAGLIGIMSNATLDPTGGDPMVTFFLIIWSSAFASSIVDNIPFSAMMIPLITNIIQNETIASAFGSFIINPLWWALSLGVGLGGNGTLIGSSAGVASVGLAEKQGYYITFNKFLKLGLPFMIVSVAVGSLVLWVDMLLRLG